MRASQSSRRRARLAATARRAAPPPPRIRAGGSGTRQPRARDGRPSRSRQIERRGDGHVLGVKTPRVEKAGRSPARPRLHTIWSMIPTGAPTSEVLGPMRELGDATSSRSSANAVAQRAQQRHEQRRARRQPAAERDGRFDAHVESADSSSPASRSAAVTPCAIVDPGAAPRFLAEADTRRERPGLRSTVFALHSAHAVVVRFAPAPLACAAGSPSAARSRRCSRCARQSG